MYYNERELEIRYADTDQMGVVYHANYIIWLELGRTSLIKELGFNVLDLEKDGYVSPVLDISIQYKAALRYGQTPRIRTWVKKTDRLRSYYGYEILHEDGTVAATATSEHIIIKKDTFRPVAFNKVAPQWYEKYVEIAHEK